MTPDVDVFIYLSDWWKQMYSIWEIHSSYIHIYFPCPVVSFPSTFMTIGNNVEVHISAQAVKQ